MDLRRHPWIFRITALAITLVVILLMGGLPTQPGLAASGESPPALDRFATPQVREAFAVAAADDWLWQWATNNAEEYLYSRGVTVPPDIGVAFLNVERWGDTITYLGAGWLPVLQLHCPPARVWWQECRKIMRVCDKQIAWINGAPVEVEKNCYSVCEQSIWEPVFSLPTRPPFPPLPPR